MHVPRHLTVWPKMRAVRVPRQAAYSSGHHDGDRFSYETSIKRLLVPTCAYVDVTELESWKLFKPAASIS